MRLGQGVEWAAHACALLAAAGEGRGLSLAALAEYHGVPAPYMAKQMQALSKAGLVRTSRGKTGGYALARPADQITLWDVTRALNGSAPLFQCTEIRQQGPCGAPRAECKRPCHIAAAFAQAETAWREALQGVTIADIAAGVGRDSSPQHITEAMHWLGSNLTDLPNR
ncbi:Rrf2 family transcriptional regulator [Novosphingobium sp.]|uniref:RrF2 family transcriptional regulator n=1 Tax=Novosphingobium sp. TaxID=1874826 RepID=UPI0025F454B3|nr:Rrf2 family transcriptional regulator [Novosphingobium sp.]MCC6924533.1 Rrf2 family transcriptional regulator [Novosphingobium sp.]